MINHQEKCSNKRWNRLQRGREGKERGRERKDWGRRKEWKLGRRKGASLLKAAQKKAKSRLFVTNNVKNVTF